MSTPAQDILDKATAQKYGGGTDIDHERNMATASGAIVGGLFGMYIAYAKKKNLIIIGAVGALIGAIAARVILPK